MDIILLESVKLTSLELKKAYDELCTINNHTDEKNKAHIIYEILKKNIEAIYKVNEDVFITGNFNYQECSQQLKPLLKNQLLLTILFQRHQDKNIIETTRRMQNSDTKSYLNENNASDYTVIDYPYSVAFIKIIEKIEEYIDSIVEITKKRYTDSFGHFSNIKEANHIIKKEYSNYLKFAKLFLDTKETIYEIYDNYDPLINGLQNLCYELIQLIVVLERADESKIIKDSCNNCEKNIYFILMDGVNSTKDNIVEQLIIDTVVLNNEIKKNKEFELICKFSTYKQDEIQGFIVGDINEFLNLVDSIYNSKVKVTYVYKPYSKIREYIQNIEDTIFNIPFSIYGPMCKEARERMNLKSYIILGNKSIQDKNLLLEQFMPNVALSQNFLA